jgi:hypothetical protein
MIGNKRQRKESESEVAETQVVAADEGDEGEANATAAAIVRAAIDKIVWTEIDRGMNRTEIAGQLRDSG